jgi:hypothetical protein
MNEATRTRILEVLERNDDRCDETERDDEQYIHTYTWQEELWDDLNRPWREASWLSWHREADAIASH